MYLIGHRHAEPGTTESLSATRVGTELGSIYPCGLVKIEDGVHTVDVDAPLLWESRLVEEYNERAKWIAGVTCVRVHIRPSSIYGLG